MIFIKNQFNDWYNFLVKMIVISYFFFGQFVASYVTLDIDMKKKTCYKLFFGQQTCYKHRCSKVRFWASAYFNRWIHFVPLLIYYIFLLQISSHYFSSHLFANYHINPILKYLFVRILVSDPCLTRFVMYVSAVRVVTCLEILRV